MKILEVTNVDFSLTHFLLPLMRVLRANGHEVVGVCADGPLLKTPREEGFRIETPPLARSFSPIAQVRALWALIRLIRREKPDMVHAHMPISGILARVAAKFCGVPCIAYTCHGFLFNQPGSAAKRQLAKLLERGCGHITDIYLTVSKEEADDAARLHIHPHPIAIGNGRDSSVFHPDAAARHRVRTELGTASQTVVIIVVSRLVRHKGYPELLAAMQNVPDAELWVVGERLASDHGARLDNALTQAQQILGPRLKCLGYRADIPALLAAADIFTLPSHFEGLPMSIIEAMLSGLPVVATNIRGPREQIVDGQTGLLVPVAQRKPLARALRQLVSQPTLRRRMGQAGRARALSLFEERDVLARTVRLLTASQTQPTD
ncbi:glycosyltransferase family 4 protein [Acetobacter ghanensis]|uniref:Glycosyl transferase group 1 n=1 Tax=Acetobacter ghanensis TaxID=431306 RepID=A0A0U5F561_9PROT|nr:glycosyltransferase family 4 protein [Acetobacter ghanensis]NHO38520.1 glycosyltransferase [Acetobacter ghanensis]GBQ44113.1 glycosyltransferase [Acetobacter ghanensis DSM 18895]CEF55289.1 glycosyl transferase group 1 [Acetobacter ghanensis]